jgi:hypothetical protein
MCSFIYYKRKINKLESLWFISLSYFLSYCWY